MKWRRNPNTPRPDPAVKCKACGTWYSPNMPYHVTPARMRCYGK